VRICMICRCDLSGPIALGSRADIKKAKSSAAEISTANICENLLKLLENFKKHVVTKKHVIAATLGLTLNDPHDDA